MQSLSPSFLKFDMRSYPWLLSVLLPGIVLAQDGGITAPISSKTAAGYSCDASRCRLPNCNCASTSPPGGLKAVRELPKLEQPNVDIPPLFSQMFLSSSSLPPMMLSQATQLTQLNQYLAKE